MATLKIGIDLIVRHIPKKLSRICWHLIARCGEITCKITGQRQRSALLQGSLEIPCIYTFRQKKFINNLNFIMNRLNLKEVNSEQAKEKYIIK